ncbi:MAG: alpha/beta hydrolase [Xanthomonadales bacterium]|nr:alpha/beta hydrolase [Xanthomonadales bacterium]
MRIRSLILTAALTILVLAGGVTAFVQFRPEAAYQAVVGLERWRADLETRSLSAGAYRWSYLRGGEGPPLLLLHGFGADKDNWTRIGPYLTDHFEVIAPDLIGFGTSSRPGDADYAIRAQAQRVLEFADAAGLEQFHVGGSSMGGYIAGALAGLAPERVLSLWLIAPGGVLAAPPSEMFLSIEQGINPLNPRTIDEFETTLAFVFHRRPFIPGPLRAYLARVMTERQGLLEKIFSDLRYRSQPLEAYLQGNTTPAFILWGEHDRVLHPSGTSVLTGIMPNAEDHVMPDTGHLPMIERPAESAELYLDWFQRRFPGQGTGSGSSTSR